MSPIDSQRTLNITGSAISMILLAILAGSIYAFVEIDVPEKNHDVLLILVGALTTNITNVVNWFFGSSLGAKTKDDSIKALTNTVAQAQEKLPPVPGAPDKTVPLSPGETVAVKATEPTP